MKNRRIEGKGRLRLLLYGLLLTLLSGPLVAHDLPDLQLANSGLGKQFAISVKGLSSQAELQIQTTNGKVLVAKTIQGSSYQSLYNLEHLREGPYRLVLKLPEYDIYQPIVVNRRAIQYDIAQRETIYRPVVRVKGRQVDVEFINPEGLPVRLSLVDEDGTLLYEETIERVIDVEKRLNLLNLPSGDYQMRIQTPLKSWKESIYLQ